MICNTNFQSFQYSYPNFFPSSCAASRIFIVLSRAIIPVTVCSNVLFAMWMDETYTPTRNDGYNVGSNQLNWNWVWTRFWDLTCYLYARLWDWHGDSIASDRHSLRMPRFLPWACHSQLLWNAHPFPWCEVGDRRHQEVQARHPASVQLLWLFLTQFSAELFELNRGFA